MVPKGTPHDIKDAIFDVLKQAMEDPAFKEYYTNNHLLPALQDGETFNKFMEQQNEDVKASLTGN